MKSSFCLWALLLASLLPTHAEDPKPTAPPPTPLEPKGRWTVRVEALMVALPEDRALTILPDLRDDSKIDAATARLLEAVKRQEATLTGYPVAIVADGQRGTSETNLEKIYPTQFQLTPVPSASGSTPDAAPVRVAMATSFEKRNLGPLLQVEPEVSPDGSWIRMQVAVQRTELIEFDAYGVDEPKLQLLDKVEQPLFFSSKISTGLTLHNGQRMLVGVHKLVKQTGNWEFFILQATATVAH